MHVLGLQRTLPGSEYDALTHKLPMMRAVKDDNELARLAAAGAAADATYGEIVRVRFSGRKETDVASDLADLLRSHGAGAGHLHRPGAGHQLDRPGRPALPPRGRDAGVRRRVRRVRHSVADTRLRHHARRGLAGRHAHLARRAVEGTAADLTPGGVPPTLQALNKHGVQQNILVSQGILTTVIALGYALIPDVSSAYWILSVITTQVYLSCTC
jgi:hypothetical protein